LQQSFGSTRVTLHYCTCRKTVQKCKTRCHPLCASGTHGTPKVNQTNQSCCSSTLLGSQLA
jgi:hypothetical protein